MEVPKKNITRKVFDVRAPKQDTDISPAPDEIHVGKVAELYGAESRRPSSRISKKKTSRYIFLFLGILGGGLLLVVAAESLKAYFVSTAAYGLAGESVAAFRDGLIDLKLLRPEAARQKFSSVAPAPALSDLIGKFGSLFSGSTGVLQDVTGISSDAVVLSSELQVIQDHLFDYLFAVQGTDLITHVEKIKKILNDLSSRGMELSSRAETFKEYLPPDAYLSLQLDLNRFNSFAGTLLGWLSDSRTHHVAVFFENPSEIRPGGGFLGSYADVTLTSGRIVGIDVHDVNDVDRGFDQNLVPPKPLQALEGRWRIADSNWFFDFADSASTTLGFMESSHLYKDAGTTFDGAVAITPKILSDILSLTGPIDIESPKATFDKDNVLTLLQTFVQAGQESNAAYPKAALQALESALLQKLKDASPDTRKAMFDLAGNWINKKDLRLYSKDPAFETFFRSYAATGEVYALPGDFEGDYLAIADGNVGGGKSDLYMRQTVTFQSQINLDGTVSDRLGIVREHKGADGKYWWYKTPNWDYLQVFTPPQASIDNFAGGVKRTITPKVNYKNGYSTVPLVASIESSAQDVFQYPLLNKYSESGKNVFATWSELDAGKKTEIDFDYTNRLYLPPADGMAYQFVFESQPGVHRSYHFEILAPVGFRFKENNLPIYQMDTDDPAGRVIVPLTLQRI